MVHGVPGEDLDRVLKFLEETVTSGSCRRFGEIAACRGYVTDEQLRDALDEQKVTALPLSEILFRKGYISVAQHREVSDVQKQDAEAAAGEKRLGKYLLKRKVGQGGMGVVYEAEDPTLRRRVALKILRDEDASPEVISRLHREASIAAQLQHPNIVGIHEVGMAQDGLGTQVHFIAMDFVEGRTLADILEEGAATRLDLLRILLEVSHAVAYAHLKGVVHRDLKPANVLVDPAGRVLLTDFGLARADTCSTRITRSHEVIGTPQYMAPEQVEGRSEGIGPRTDVYALGVMLYQIVTGHLPFESDTPGRIYQSILNEEPKPPSRWRRAVKPDLEVVCQHAMEKQSARRYPSAKEFSEDLSRFLRGEPIQARRTSWIYRTGMKLAKRRALLATVGAAAVVVAIVATVAVIQLTRWSDFERSREAAREALAAGLWAKARIEAQRAQRFRPEDEELRDMVRRCEVRLEEEEKKLEQARWYEKLQEETVKPILTSMQNIRPYFYVADVDLRPRMREVEKAVEKLEVAARDPRSSSYADVWTLLGMGWYFLGDTRRAEEALLRAVDISPDGAQAHFYLGRIRVEQAIALRISPTGHAKTRFREEMGKAVGHLRRAEGGTEELDRHVILGYLAWAEGKTEEVLRICREGREKFGGAPGTEEFSMLLGYSSLGVSGESISCFTEAIARRPHYPLAYFSRGLARKDREGCGDAALADFAKAIEQNSRFYQAYYYRGVHRDAEGDIDGAIADLSEAIRINPAYAPAYVQRAHGRIHRSDFEGAIRDCTEALRIDPKYLKAYETRARAREKLGDAAGAEEDLAKAVDSSPGTIGELLGRAAQKAKQGDFDGAIRDYSAVLRIRPDFEGALTGRGGALLAKGDLDGAVRDFSRALELKPRWSHGFRMRADAWEKKGDLDRALSDLSQAIEIDPKYAWALYKRGLIRQRKGDAEKAFADFSEAIRVNPHSALARYKRAEMWEARKDFDRAIEDYTAAIESKPSNDQLHLCHLGRAGAREKKGDVDGAIADYSEAIRIWPNPFLAYTCRGLAKELKKDWDGAIADYSEAIRLNPKWDNPYACRARILAVKEEWDAAIADYSLAIALAPDRIGLYSGRSKARWKRGDRAGEIADLTDVIRLNPRYPQAHHLRGHAREAVKNLDGAIDDYSEAIRLRPEEAEPYTDRGCALLRKGDVAGAIADLRHALEIAPSEWKFRKMTEEHLELALQKTKAP